MTDRQGIPDAGKLVEQCGSCRFFIKHEAQHVYGDCHRQPPQFSFYANIYEPAGYGGERKRIDITRERGGVWPNVSQDEWCGEFRARAQASPAATIEEKP